MIKIIYIFFIFFVVFNSSICAKWVSENTQTRGKSCNSIFSSSKHASLRSKMSALSLYSLIASLQSDKSLNSNTKQWTESKAKAEYITDVTWRHQLSFLLYSFPFPETFLKLKKQFLAAEIQEILLRNTFSKLKIVKSWSPGQEVLLQPRTWLEQQDWFSVQITK